MIEIAASAGETADVLHDLLLESGRPSIVVTDRETCSYRVDCAVRWLGTPAGKTVFPGLDPERIVIADPDAVTSREPGVAIAEAERVRERIDEVLEIKSGVRYDCFSRAGYVERNGVSYFLGRALRLTDKQRLIVRLLEIERDAILDAQTVARCCWSSVGTGAIRPGAVRTAISEINAA